MKTTTAIPVVKYDLVTGEILKEHPSALAAKTDGFNPSEISKCAQGKQRSHKKYGWAYKKDGLPKTKPKPRHSSAKAVVSYNVHTRKDIQLYDKIADADQDGFDPAKVSECCRGSRDTHGGLGWRFANDEPRKIELKIDEAKRIVRCDPETKTILQIYDSLKSAARDTRFSFDRGNIRKCLQGKLNKHGGFIWQYAESQNSDISGIYAIVNTQNFKKFYIGSSKNIPARWKRHKEDLSKNIHKNKYLQNVWNKHGDEIFQYRVLQACHPDMRKRLEQYFLDKFSPLYNMAPKVDQFPLSTKPIVRYNLESGEAIQTYVSAAEAAQEGYSKTMVSGCCNGKRGSHDGFGWRFADGTTPAWKYKTTARHVISYNLTNKADVKRYSGAHKAEEDGFNQSKIFGCCNDKLNSHKGLGWRYADQPIPDFIKPARQILPVEKIDLRSGEVVKEYENANRAGLEENLNVANIRMCLYGQRVTCGGFRWRYKGEVSPPRKNKRITTPRVECIKDGQLIKTYEYAALVKHDGFSPSKVSECVQGKRKSHKGYQWRFCNE